MKCEKCNIDMKEGRIEGKHPFEQGFDAEVEISIHIPTGEQGNILGLKYDKTNICDLKAYICPNCKKVEFYLKDNQ